MKEENAIKDALTEGKNFKEKSKIGSVLLHWVLTKKKLRDYIE